MLSQLDNSAEIQGSSSSKISLGNMQYQVSFSLIIDSVDRETGKSSDLPVSRSTDFPIYPYESYFTTSGKKTRLPCAASLSTVWLSPPSVKFIAPLPSHAPKFITPLVAWFNETSAAW